MIPIKKFSARCSQGPFLNINEDGLDVDLNLGLILLLDGMGGGGKGDLFVLETIESIKKYYTHLVDDPNSTMPFYFNPNYSITTNALLNALKRTHEQSFKKNKEKGILSRSAACVLGLCFEMDYCTFISIGNCSSYLSRLSHFIPIFSEDNYRFYQGDCYQKFLRSIPQHALGLFEEFYFEIRQIKLMPKDRIILFTDGVNSLVNLIELETLLNQKQENNNDIIDMIFDYVNNKGNVDNQSAIILEF